MMGFVLLAALMVESPSGVEAASLHLTWDAPTTNVSGTRLTDLAGYHVYVVRLHPVGAGADQALPRSFLLSHARDLRAGDEVRPDRISAGVLIDLNPTRDAP